MAWVAVNKDGSELICYPRPSRNEILGMWDTYDPYCSSEVDLPKGTIEKLIGYELTWKDEPVELTEKAAE